MIEKRILTGGIDKDLDERIIGQQDYQYALNVRNISGEPVGVIQNLKGNTEVTISLPSGTNKVIGQTEDVDTNTVFFFIYNSSDNHSIFYYNTLVDKAIKLIESQYLNFLANNPIVGNVIEETLFFTDGFSEPKKLNIRRAKKGEYDSITSNQSILVIQHPPKDAPTGLYKNDSSQKGNSIAYTVPQFRYRYFYADGEISAWSPISNVINNDYLLLNELKDSNQYNAVDVTVKAGNSLVKKFEIAVRLSANMDFESEGVFDKEELEISDDSDYVYRFDGSKTRTLLDRGDLDKLFDNVPKSARAQTVANDNRIVYGDVTTGFDRVNVAYQAIPDYEADLNDSTLYDRAELTEPSSVISGTSDTKRVQSFGWSTSSVPSTVPLGAMFVMDFSFNFTHAVTDPDGVYADDFYSAFGSVVFSVANSVSQSKSDFMDDVITVIEDSGLKLMQSRLGDVEISASFASDTLTITLTHTLTDWEWKSGASPLHGINKEVAFYQTLPTHGLTFKSNSEYEFGIVYYDDGNRSSYVQLGDLSKGKVAELQGRGRAFFNWYLINTPPAWATHYQWVYTPINYNFQYLVVDRAYTTDAGHTSTSIALDISSYAKRVTDLGLSASNDLSWIKPGDVVRVYRAEEGTPQAYVDKESIFFEVVKLHVETDTTSEVSGSTEGTFLIVEPSQSVAGYTATDLSKLDHAIVEVFNQDREEAGVKVFYEFDKKYDIGNPHASNRYHKGDTDQSFFTGVAKNLVFSNDVVYNNSSGFLSIDYSAATGTTQTTLNGLSVNDAVYIKNSSNEVLGYFIVKSHDTTNDVIGTHTPYDSSVHNNEITKGEKVVPAQGTFQKGDVYIRERDMSVTTVQGATGHQHIQFVEDKYPSDKYKVDARNIGRAHINSPFEKQRRLDNVMLYSENFNKLNYFNGLSSFPTQNRFEIKESLGAIVLLDNVGDNILCIQENGISYISSNKQVITTATGETMLALSSNVLNEPMYISESFGIQQPHHYVKTPYESYFLDYRRKSICRIQGKKVEPISAVGLRNFFNDKIALYEKYNNGINIVAGSDNEFGEIVYSFKSFDKVATASITVPDGLGTKTHAFEYLNFIVEQEDSGYIGWFIPIRLISGEDKGTQLLSDICSNGYYEINNEESYGTTSTTSIKVNTNQSDDLTLSKSISFSEGRINHFSEASGQDIVNSNSYSVTTSAQTHDTLGFNIASSKWTSHFSYEPEYFASMNNTFLSFSGGTPWLHNSNSTRNSFYGTTYSSKINIIFNQNRDNVSSYDYLKLEGNKKWDIDYSTDYNSSSIKASTQCVGGSGSDRLTCELNGGVFVSDYRVVDGNEYADFRRDGSNGIEGERPKGYYVKLEMENSDTTETKLYSVTVGSDNINPVEN